MLPNDNFGIDQGSFTDDTSMALCLAHSLADCRGEANTVDQVRKYLAWWQTGYMSSTGSCFDIGASTRSSLAHWAEHLENDYNHLKPDSPAAVEALCAFERRIHERYSQENLCGNGSLMRVLPAALVARSEPDAVRLAQQSSMPTHPHPRCVHSCMIYAALVYQALNGASKSELAASLHESLMDSPNKTSDSPIEPALRERLGDYRSIVDWQSTASRSIRSTGYVVDSLEASLWAFFSTDGFEEGAIRVVNLGDDADTVGAIYGGLAGAFYGTAAVPERWVREMKRMDLVDDVVRKLLTHREQYTSSPR